MQSLSAEKILAVWEAGRQQHELDRALTLLAAGSQGSSRDALADLTIGERDARLLRLRTLVFGRPRRDSRSARECGERVELPIDTAALAKRRCRPTDRSAHNARSGNKRKPRRLSPPDKPRSRRSGRRAGYTGRSSPAHRTLHHRVKLA